MFWLYAVVSVILVSLISLIGILTLAMKKSSLKKITLILVSFAVGGLFGDAFIHLLPEAFEKLGTGLLTSLYVVFGILIFFVLEKFLRWRHCHITDENHIHPIVTMNLVGDAIHNFIDGLLIGASYIVSIPIGITTTLAIVLHEIPQEIGDFGILIHGGLTQKRALLFNFLSAVTAIVGTIIALVVSVEGFAIALLPVAAGGFLYIAGSDLIPELQHNVNLKTSFIQFISILLGIGIMSLLLLVG